MHQVKEFLNFLDYIVATFWGITVVEVVPILATNGLSIDIMTSLSDLVKFLFSIAGLIYLVFRLIHFIRMSKINIEIRKEELYEKQNANFNSKFKNEFK
jgi:hypothetical protein